MPTICYTDKTFTAAHREVIDRANTICREYAALGFDLTVRQLFYQFVSRAWIANKQTEYARLVSIISAARLAGEMDWNYIQDRTRNLRDRSHWRRPEDIIRGSAQQYHKDLWADQDYRLEVWIEKDALVGVLANVCNELDVPYFSFRGYTSLSEVWVAARRIEGYMRKGKSVEIIHLGDHDSSGIDMTRDIEERLVTFLEGDGFNPMALTINRIALNMDQVLDHDPPPNPAKQTDPRAAKYIAMHGESSWELDALEPTVIEQLVRDTVESKIDWDAWDAAKDVLEAERKVLIAISNRYADVVAFLEER